jgi:membrane-associated HD superfamily phosphohydrolase
MKQPSAPELYPNLSLKEIEEYPENGQNYRLQKISEIEKTLLREIEIRKSLYKKYKRGINFTDSIDTTLISTSVILATVGIAIPVLLPVQITAAICGSVGVCIKLIRRRLTTKANKHYKIKTIADSKLNSIKDLISKSLTDGQISESEFKLILDELEKYIILKEDNKIKPLNNIERNKIIEETENRVRNELKKKYDSIY